MPSQTRRLSSRERSAAKKIQTKFRNRKTKKKQVSAMQRIENKVRSIKIKNYEKERSRRHEEEVAKFRNISTQRNKRKEVAQKFRTRIKTIINNKEKKNECAICLDKMMPNDNVTSLECGHKFHSHCIRRSLTATRGTCPLCRTVVTNIPYSSTYEQQIQPPPPPPPVQPNIIDPIQRRQYILARLERIQILEDAITQQRPQLPWPPEIPNITYEEALSNLIRARQIVEQARILFYEASENYQNYRNVRMNSITIDQELYNMYSNTRDLLTRARENRNNADRIADNLEFRPLNILI
jgi:hypothetical protein